VCGIAGFHIRDKYRSKLTDADLNRLVDGLLMGIEPRGKDATGYVAVDRKQGTFFEKRDVRAEHFVTVRKRIPASAKTVLLHTRATTKGTEKDNENNHPVEYKGVYATHNGMIRNDDELFKDLEIERPAAVDSCIVPVLGHLAGGLDKLPEHLRSMMGSYALAVIDPAHNPNETLLVRGASSPLYWIDATWMYIWASSQFAIREAWESVWAKSSIPDYTDFNQLEEGEFLHIKDDKALRVRFIEQKDVYRRTTGTRTGTSGLGKCVECGDDRAIKLVGDSYKEKDKKGKDKHLVSWEIPLCRTCEQIDPGDLTYRHCDRELKMKITSLDELCKTCDWFPKLTHSKTEECSACWAHRMEQERKEKEQERIKRMKDMGLDPTQTTVKCADCERPYSVALIECRPKDAALVCKGCLNGDKGLPNIVPAGLQSARCVKCKAIVGKDQLIRRDYQFLCRARCEERTMQEALDAMIEVEKQQEEPKQMLQRSLQGSDAKKFLELNPGDAIPSELYTAWSHCAGCGHNNVRFISMEGNAICTTCSRKEGNPNAKEAKGDTDSLAKLQEEVRKREIADDPENNPMYQKCMVCTDAPWQLAFELNETAWGYLCDDCFTSSTLEDMEEDAQPVRDNHQKAWIESPPVKVEQEDVDEAMLTMKIKIRACVETGWELDVPGHYVMWCVDECDVDSMEDNDKAVKVTEIIDRYGDNQWIIETLIRHGRDDLIPAKSRLTEEALDVAVSFTKED
jgi:hypothetical protein